jgi:hypothetical protein
VGIFVLIAFRRSSVMLVTDRSWTVLLDVTIAKSKSDRMSNPTGDTSVTDVVLGPNEGSSTGNVTGGRKLARYDFGRRPDAIPHATSSRQVRHCTPVQTNVHAPEISALVPAASTASSETS